MYDLLFMLSRHRGLRMKKIKQVLGAIYSFSADPSDTSERKRIDR
jgi:hypothetical protein